MEGREKPASGVSRRKSHKKAVRRPYTGTCVAKKHKIIDTMDNGQCEKISPEKEHAPTPQHEKVQLYDIYERHSRVIMVDVENYNVNGEYLWSLDLFLKT